MYDTAIKQTDVRELNLIWNDASIAKDIGINLHSINEFATKPITMEDTSWPARNQCRETARA